MKRKRAPLSTTMTDTAFLLLFFFLIFAVVTQMSPIPIASAQSTQSDTTGDSEILLVVGRDGTLYCNGNPVTVEDLPHEEVVSLHADRDTPFHVIFPIIDSLRKTGTVTVRCIVEDIR